MPLEDESTLFVGDAVSARLAQGFLNQEMVVEVSQDFLVAQDAQGYLPAAFPVKPEEGAIEIVAAMQGLWKCSPIGHSGHCSKLEPMRRVLKASLI